MTKEDLSRIKDLNHYCIVTEPISCYCIDTDFKIDTFFQVVQLTDNLFINPSA